MKKKTAVVTGGASGLGLAIAKKLASNDIRTIIVGRTEKKLVAARDELGDLSGYRVFDLTHLDSIPGLIAEIEENIGSVDILVNNAGIHLKKPFTEVTDDEYQQIIQTNQTAIFSLSREVAKAMITRERGNILNISSMASFYGIPEVIAYTAAKSAVEGMTRAMAVELSPHGIRVNCLAPGFIRTDMSSKAFERDPERKQKVLSRTPMRKLGTPEDVANAAYFLTSDEASFITGAVLPVDGGNSIGF